MSLQPACIVFLCRLCHNINNIFKGWLRRLLKLWPYVICDQNWEKKPSSINVALVTANKSNFINIDLRKEEKDLLNFMKLQT